MINNNLYDYFDEAFKILADKIVKECKITFKEIYRNSLLLEYLNEETKR